MAIKTDAFRLKPVEGPLGAASSPEPSAQEILARLGESVPYPLDAEHYEFLGTEDIAFDRYTSPDFFKAEMDHVWGRVWQWACREEHIPDVGDWIVYDIGKTSIIVARTAPDRIQGFYNACLHRGTRLCGFADEGSSSEFRCPYHGWAWHVDGRLKDIPSAWDFGHVDPKSFSLPEVRVETWNGFVFVNLDVDAPPLADYLAPLPDHFRNWDLANRYVALHIVKELPCNWKAAKEAFMENYHTRETHPQLLSSTSEPSTQYDVYGDHVSRFYALMGMQSPHLDRQLTEQELLDQMLTGDGSVRGDDRLKVPEGGTARRQWARFLREELDQRRDVEVSHLSDSELIDTIEYTLFPNMFLFPSLSLPMIYRFRPLATDPERSLFDLLFLAPVPRSGERPPPADPVRIGPDDSYAIVPGMDAGMAEVYDQDTGNLCNQQAGFHTSAKAGMTLGNYQEIRIRHFHQTLDKYLARALDR